MDLADELIKLERLRDSGALSEDEFQTAKQKVLNQPPPASGEDQLGRAVDRYISYRLVIGLICTVVMVLFLVVALSMLR